jgi:hypothetical protein
MPKASPNPEPKPAAESSSAKTERAPVPATKSALASAFEIYVAGGESNQAGLNAVIREIVKRLEG